MSDELLLKIIDRLDTLIELQRNPPNLVNQHSMPWTVRLLAESTTGEDMDGNGECYGIDFIFNQTPASHPPSMQFMHEELLRGWGTKKKITFIEYVKTLPEDAPWRQPVIDWIRGLKNGRS